MAYHLENFETFVFDCDGTLLPEGEMGMPEEVYTMIRALYRNGKKIIIASGRQLANLILLFDSVADCDLYFIGENGNIAGHGGRVVDYVEMPRKDAFDIVHKIKEYPQSEAVISGLSRVYFWQNESTVPKATTTEYFKFRVVKSLDEIREPILKVSYFHPEGVDPKRADFLRDLYGDPYHGAISGFYWQDFTLGNKGEMLEHLSQKYHFTKAKTVAFGDNWNDREMLEWAGLSFIKTHSDPALLRFADGAVDDVPRFVNKSIKFL